MNRKLFLSSFIPLSGVLYAFNTKARSGLSLTENLSRKIPAYLKHGDIIGITCPAGYITQEEIAPAVELMQSWGYIVVIGKTVGARDNTFGGTDKERLDDLQQMLNDTSIKAIMCARGGYGAVKIIDDLDFSIFKKSPKWLIGFSDITVLHTHINSNFGKASIHSKMCNSFPKVWAEADEIQIATVNSIHHALSGNLMEYEAVPNVQNREGSAEGELIGGNLRCIENLAGTVSEIETKDKILFLEDVGEPLYNIDRMLYNLKRTGKLAKLKGLIIGGFRIKAEEGDSFGRTLEQIVLERVSAYNYPVCFDFPVGHQKNNYALKCGVKHRLIVNTNQVALTELR